MKHLNVAFALVCFGCSFAGVEPARAQAGYPARPIKLVVPSSPGGGTDITARVIAPQLSDQLGQQVVIENRSGAGTMIGTEIVAHAPADGYTLLMGISTLAINPAMTRKFRTTRCATSPPFRRSSRCRTSSWLIRRCR